MCTVLLYLKAAKQKARGLAAMILALTGLITLAVDNVNSYLLKQW